MTPSLRESLSFIRFNFSDKKFKAEDTYCNIKHANDTLNNLVNLGYLEKVFENGAFYFFLIA